MSLASPLPPAAPMTCVELFLVALHFMIVEGAFRRANQNTLPQRIHGRGIAIKPAVARAARGAAPRAALITTAFSSSAIPVLILFAVC